ncbi:MAG TPA: NADH-quinone oxidoreductase subunit L [Bacteroidetes bacterium]|nr:NADH-quinone oxidoreductase subunit L [Ignavibacteria bacterium]HCA43417.1 NADH-quinone oxidoreductase subunit L [Bacteroidota bacterium]HCN37648.1 NADH-quinone oxidoreductase subunit L [Bacteroidota bacterium]
MSNLFYLVVLLPLVGFFINGLFGKKINNEKISGWISSLLIFIPFVIAAGTFFELLAMPPDSRAIHQVYFSWIATGDLGINYAYLIDPLSISLVLVITGIGFLIHLYSIGYMHGDPGFAKYFAFLNLFVFAMLNLVLGDNLLLIFLGWEGVGLCSYLLIGFWYEKKFTGDAAKKAFIVNRIGDFGFMIAMFLIFANFGTLEISGFLSQIAGIQINDGLLIAISLLLFLGACGKSAQIPLYVWLPDAMAGPTPVSALIHAATMVTAGIYLLARTSLLYALAPFTTHIVLIVGLITALMAATIALKQNDIKKILAYSTVSQLGFMFVAIGNFAFTIAIFHLITHAFFKALLFLGSGSVIHGMHEEQDITKMGGLKNKMKITFITFFIGSLALAGIPPLSGFFSKDEIMYLTFITSGPAYYIITLIAAACTAFYIFRLIGLTFYGKPRYDEAHLHPHESPSLMTIPLILLAVLSAVGGFIGLPHWLGHSMLGDWLAPVFSGAMSVLATYQPEHHASVALELGLVAVSVIVATTMIIISFRKFSKQTTFEEPKGFGKVLENKYYVDEIYDKTIVEPIQQTSDKFLWKIFDVKIIDGFINGVANYISRLSFDWRKIQTGVIQDYTTLSVAGIILLLIYLIFR